MQTDSTTLLPPTCGKETGLPGVPGVGCVATVKYSSYRSGDVKVSFSACVIAGATDVYVLGPNMDTFLTKKRLTSRRLWRTPSSHTALEKLKDVPLKNQNPLVSSDEDLSETSNYSAPASPPANVVSSKNVCLQAFLLYQRKAATPDVASTQADDDTVAVLVAWSDEQRTHHVSLLLVSLLNALRPSCSSSKLKVAYVKDIIRIPPQEYVLRLFYDKSLSSQDEEATTEDGSSTSNDGKVKIQQLVMCSTYHMTNKRESNNRSKGTPMGGGSGVTGNAVKNTSGVGATGASTSSGGGNSPAGGGGAVSAAAVEATVVKVRQRGDSSSTPSGGGGGGGMMASSSGLLSGQTYSHAQNTADRAPPRGSYMEGNKRFISVSNADELGQGKTVFLYDSVEKTLSAASLDSPTSLATAPCGLYAGEAFAEEEVQPWCRDIPTGHVISAFAVQHARGALTNSSEKSMLAVAAVGTTDGRVYVLRREACTLVKRLTGPIADLCFVNTRHVRGPHELRPHVIEELLKQGSDKHADAELPSDDSAALMILDSVGRVVVLRAINSQSPVAQLVKDIKQVVALEEKHETPLTLSRRASPTPSHIAPKGARNFLDLSTLRFFFGKKEAAAQERGPADAASAAAAAAAAAAAPAAHKAMPNNSSLSSRPLKEADTSGWAGHILSRGVLCAARLESATEGNEVLVSTMGQAVVSIPFDTREFTFAIAGFMVTPTPMFFIGFADFFGSGCEDLVMASLQSIIVARRSPQPVKDKAKLLLRHLNKRKSCPHGSALHEQRTANAIET